MIIFQQDNDIIIKNKIVKKFLESQRNKIYNVL